MMYIFAYSTSKNVSVLTEPACISGSQLTSKTGWSIPAVWAGSISTVSMTQVFQEIRELKEKEGEMQNLKK